jgi:hypothetical protein
VPAGGSSGERFGWSVDLDRERLAVGAPLFTVPGSGLVQRFQKQASGWQRLESLLPTRPAVHGHFGTGLACAGELAVIAEGASVTTVSLRQSLCRTLLAQPATLSLTNGGRHTLRLNPGREHAGRRFLLMGSASGDSPGFRLGAARIPLVPDAYLASSLPGRRRPPFVNNFGLLGANAPQAEVTIDVPPGTDLALAGLVLHHAFVVLERGVVHVSNTRTLTLVP